MRLVLVLIGGPLLVSAAIAHLWVRVRMKPSEAIDEVYHELEDQDPDYRRYTQWLQWTFGGVALGVLMLFLAMIL